MLPINVTEGLLFFQIFRYVFVKLMCLLTIDYIKHYVARWMFETL
jgi:hypothetical protein